ncbi:NAD/NADP transhydrogenase alpha subunit [Streptomyces sp. TLI_235]|nr:NAD(P) transhydrogenase subunit alpha [Streptomyces sp. TLI_235]PBC70904.1 NAD/NADP transhydrogenase alpha subunit [Streptomyces sp. TLI_235]
MSAVVLGICRESLPGERRVALVPRAVPAVRELGVDVLVEAGAGTAAGFPDAAYAAAGAALVGGGELAARAHVLAAVRRPPAETVARLHRGQLLLCLLRAWRAPHLVRRWADAGLTLIGTDPPGRPGLPPGRLDAGAGQASLAGYKAVLLAADRLGRELAGGVTEPALVLVLGAGPAGLRAIDTARRLGATVHAYDTGRAAQAAIAAHGGFVLPLGSWDVRRRAAVLSRFEVVVSSTETAPMSIDTAAVRSLRPGSVVVDLVCDADGRSVEPAVAGAERTVGGVLVIGAGDLAAAVPATASTAYAQAVAALLAVLVPDGLLTVDPADPDLTGLLIAHAGTVTDPRTAGLLRDATAAAGLP